MLPRRHATSLPSCRLHDLRLSNVPAVSLTDPLSSSSLFNRFLNECITDSLHAVKRQRLVPVPKKNVHFRVLQSNPDIDIVGYSEYEIYRHGRTRIRTDPSETLPLMILTRCADLPEPQSCEPHRRGTRTLRPDDNNPNGSPVLLKSIGFFDAPRLPGLMRPRCKFLQDPDRQHCFTCGRRKDVKLHDLVGAERNIWFPGPEEVYQFS